MAGHASIERQVAALHAAIAAMIRAGDSRPIDRALQNLDRWRTRFGGVLPRGYQEWEVLLMTRDVDRVLEILLSGNEDAIRRRSNSPFTGVLGTRERTEIMRNAA